MNDSTVDELKKIFDECNADDMLFLAYELLKKVYSCIYFEIDENSFRNDVLSTVESACFSIYLLRSAYAMRLLT